MSFLGGVLGGIGGFLTGGPAGAVLGAAAGFSRGGVRGVPMIAPRAPMITPFAPPGIFTMPGGMEGGGMGMTCPPGTRCDGISMDGFCAGACVPYSMGGMGAMTGMLGLTGRCPLPAPRGFHWNQRTYCTLKHGVVPKCTKVIKNRRLNPANGHAARRAVRRITATHRLLKRIEKSIRRIKGVRSAKIPRQAAGGRREVAIVQ